MAQDVVGPSPSLTHSTRRRSSWPTCSEPGSGSSSLAAPDAGRPDRRPAGRHRRPGRPAPAVAVGASRPGPAGRRFPLAAPSWPESACRARRPRADLGVDYDTDWSRRYPVRLARAMVLDNVTRPLAQPSPPRCMRGTEGLVGLEAPVIFAANHASHVDTPLLLELASRCRFRHRTVVGGGRRLLLRPTLEGRRLRRSRWPPSPSSGPRSTAGRPTWPPSWSPTGGTW